MLGNCGCILAGVFEVLDRDLVRAKTCLEGDRGTCAQIEFHAPRVGAVLARAGRLNLLDLLDAFPKSDPASPREAKAPRPVLLRRTTGRHRSRSMASRSRWAVSF